MKSDSIAYTVAGICFGIILGWVIGTQQARSVAATAAPVAAAPAPAASPATGQRQAPPLDEARVQALKTTFETNPKDASVAIQLGNTYFDAEHYDDAITWYEQALRIEPRNPDASTDLGVSYYYTNRTDDALKQFDLSLQLDPRHTKTLLNQGIVLAFGKNNLAAAAEAWRKVVEYAPNTPEAQAAQRGLEGIAASQGGGSAAAPSNQ